MCMDCAVQGAELRASVNVGSKPLVTESGWLSVCEDVGTRLWRVLADCGVLTNDQRGHPGTCLFFC